MKRRLGNSLFRGIAVFTVMAFLLTSVISFGNPMMANAKKVKVVVKSVSVTNVVNKKLSLRAGNTFTLKTSVKVTPNKAANKKVEFSSDTSSVASVSSVGVITAKKAGTAKITVTSAINEKKSVTISVTVTAAVKVTKITLNSSSIELDESAEDPIQLKAKIAPANASNQKVVWTTANDSIADVDEDGNVYAYGAGTTYVTAKAADGGGATARCKVVVTPSDILIESITLDETELSLGVGEESQLSADIAPEDATDDTVNWSSDDEDVATVDEDGNVTAVGVGTTVITVESADGSDVSAECKVVVTPAVLISTLTLSESDLELASGDTQQLDVTIDPEEVTNSDLTWSSDDSDVATVDEDGNVTAVSEGTTVVRVVADDGGGASAECTISVTGDEPGDDPEPGDDVLVKSITLSQASLVVSVDAEKQLVATVGPSDATCKDIVWTSDNEDVASVDDNGVVTGEDIGTATITATATDESNVFATCKVEVKAAENVPVNSIVLSETSLTMAVGAEDCLSTEVFPDEATEDSVIWSSSDSSVVTVDSEGNIKAIKAGTALIKATAVDGSGISATCTITVQ